MKLALAALTLCLLQSPSLAQSAKPADTKPRPDLKTRVFETAPGFLRFLQTHSPSHTLEGIDLVPDDPFAAPLNPAALESPAEAQHRQSTRALLQRMGIAFPEGAAAYFDSAAHRLHVRHTEAALNVIATVLQRQALDSTASAELTLHLIEAPGSRLRTLPAAPKDTARNLRQLLTDAAQPGSNVKIVHTAALQTNSGQRAELEAGMDYAHLKEMRLDKEGFSAVPDRIFHGLRFAIDPVVGREVTEISLNISIESLSPPSAESQTAVIGLLGDKVEVPFPGGRLTTATRCKNGDTILIGLWTPHAPTGAAPDVDILQAAFITAHATQPRILPHTVAAPLTVDLTQPHLISRHTFEFPNDEWLIGATNHETGLADITTVLAEQKVVLSKNARAEINSPTQLIVEGDLETREVIQQWVSEEWEGLPKTAAITTHIVRGPSRILRPWHIKAAGAGDHAAILDEATAAAARGEVTFAATAYAQGKSGQKLTSQAALHRSHLTETHLEKTVSSLSAEVRPLGLVVEMEPAISTDGHKLDLPMNITWQPAPLIPRQQPFRDPVSGTNYEYPWEDDPIVRVQTQSNFIRGGTRVIAAWNPQGDPAFARDDIMEMLFITADVLHSLGQNLIADAASLIPPQSDPEKLVMRVFKVPPDFITNDGVAKAAASKESWSRQARQVLEAQGIPFPEGSTAVYAPGGTLIIINTPANQNLIEMFIGTGCGTASKPISFTCHLIEGPGGMLRELLRESANRADHNPQLQRLLMLAEQGQVKPLATLNTTATGGQRVKVEHRSWQPHILHIIRGQRGVPEVERELTPVGSQLEVDPVVGADGYTLYIHLTAEFSPAPPHLHTERLTPPDAVNAVDIPLIDFHVEKLTTGLTMTSGTARILALWKPTGKPEFTEKDLLHIAILEARVVELSE